MENKYYNQLMNNPLENIPLEQMILAIIINDNNSYDGISGFIKPNMFANGKHSFLYEKMVQLFRLGNPVNVATLYPIITTHQEYGITIQYLEEIVKNIYGKENLMKYCGTLRDLFLRRKVLTVMQQGSVRLQEFVIDEKSENIIEKIERDIFNIVDHHDSKTVYKLGDSAVNFAHKIAQHDPATLTGIDTGFRSLNELLGGFQRGELIVLAGRPSMGKTALAVAIGVNAAKNKQQKNSVLFFSLEMPEEQITMRILSAESSIDSFRLRSGRQSAQESILLMEKAQSLSPLKFFIDDIALTTITNIRITSRRIKRMYGLDLIVIDYLQLIKNEGSNDTRSIELGHITQGLKSIAKELNVSVVVLSQLSRAVESRDDKRPQMSDLRESGAIEQDADLVMFIYREEYYLKRKEPREDKVDEWTQWKAQLDQWENCAEVLIEKNRNGSIGVCKLFYDMGTSVFRDF
jgi:replicative DNA helicase